MDTINNHIVYLWYYIWGKTQQTGHRVLNMTNMVSRHSKNTWVKVRSEFAGYNHQLLSDWSTLPETKIAPENRLSQKESNE